MGRTPLFSHRSTVQANIDAASNFRSLSLPTVPKTNDPLQNSAPRTSGSRLERNEIIRRLWHFGPGVLALALTQAPGLDSISTTAMVTLVLLGFGTSAAALFYQKTFSRSQEVSCIPAVIGYVAPVLILLCAFPKFPELALTLLGIVAFGDGSATLFGLLYGSAKLPWNPCKSWVGTLAFILVGVPMGTLIYQITADPHVSPHVSLLCGGVAAIFAGIMESLPLAGNDNLRTGSAAAVGLLLMHALAVGFY